MSVNFDLKLVVDSFKQSMSEALSATQNFSSTVNRELNKPQKSFDSMTNLMLGMGTASDSTSKSIDGVTESANQSGTSVGGMTIAMIGASIATKALEVVLSIVKETIFGSIQAYAEAETSLNKLKQSMTATGTYSEQAAAQVVEFATQLQATTTLEDDAVVANIALARSLGASTNEAEKMTLAAANMSSAIGGTLTGNTEDLAKTLGGTLPRSLALAIPGLKSLTVEQLKAGAAFDIVNKKFAGAAQNDLNSYSGKLKALENQYGNVKESIGALIVNSGIFQGIMSGLMILVVNAQVFLAKYGDTLKSVALAVGVVTIAWGAWAVANAVLSGSFYVLASAIWTATAPIAPLIAILGGLVAVATLVVKYWDYLVLGFLKSELAIVKLWQSLNGLKESLGMTPDSKGIQESIDKISLRIDAQKKSIDEKNKAAAEEIRLAEENKKLALAPIKVAPNAGGSTTDKNAPDNTAALQSNKQRLEDERFTATQIELVRTQSKNALLEQDRQHQIDEMTVKMEGTTQTLQQEVDSRMLIMTQRQMWEQEDLASKQNAQLLELESIYQHEIAKANLIKDSEEQKKATTDANNKYALEKEKALQKSKLDTISLSNKQEIEKEKQKNEDKKTLAREHEQNQRDTLNTISTMQSSNNKVLATIGKAAAIASIAIDTPAAIAKALASAPPPFNFALAGLVGTAMAMQAAKVAGLNFATGGIVPGTSFTGDRVSANLNSGEMVLNKSQQATLFAQANGASSSSSNDSLLDAIDRLGSRIQNMEIKLFTSDSNIALATSRGIQDGIILGTSR